MAPKITFCTGCLSCLDLSQRLAPISPPHVWANANRSSRSARSRLSFANAPAGGSYGTRSHSCRLWRRPLRWVCTPTRSATGDSDGPKVTSAGTRSRDGGATPVFPPGPRAGHGHRGLRSRHAPRKRGATRSVEAVCGGCWQPMPANRGGTRTGSCLGILTSPKRLDHCWICRRAPGKAQTPHDLADLEAPRLRLAWYESLSNPSPTPVPWTFDHTQLAPLLATIKAHHTRLTAHDDGKGECYRFPARQ